MRDPKDVKVVVTGGLNCTESLWCLYRGFEWVGCKTVYVQAQEIAAGCKRIREGMWAELAEASKDADLIVYWQGRHAGDPARLADLYGSLPNTKTVYVSIDDPYIIDHFTDEERACTLVHDYGVTCCPASMDWYSGNGMVPIVGYPPCDRELHGKAVTDTTAVCDISFVAGNPYPKARYPEVIADRMDILATLGKVAKVHVYGTEQNWSKLPAGCEYKGWRAWRECPGLYAASKLNLTTHVRPDGYQYLNMRTIEAMASGGCTLLDRVAGIDAIFRDGVEAALWGSVAELVEKAQYLLAHDAERMAVAAEGRAKALNLFDNEALARRIIEKTGVLER